VSPSKPPTTPSPVKRVEREPAANTFFVAGCNVDCDGCSIGGGTDVRGVVDGVEVFPVPAAGGGTRCSMNVVFGTTVTLRAVSSEGLVLDSWHAPNPRDFCPCEGTEPDICTFIVTGYLAQHYDRVYCGAVWRPQAQIGH
jgi:hypothetical protein